ncbi:MAG: hypothetical protein KDA20_02785 [Phycisphaerales bacterium]|nr:hypothetical protein [Phycisphaerales bacterium]
MAIYGPGIPQPSGKPKKRLDMREFFARFNDQAFIGQIASMVNAGSQAEVDQTTREAAQAIPLLDALIAQKRAAEAEGDEVRAKLWLGAVIQLIAIYRLAEDMGYEW